MAQFSMIGAHNSNVFDDLTTLARRTLGKVHGLKGACKPFSQYHDRTGSSP
jgi:hypothetical protein